MLYAVGMADDPSDWAKAAVRLKNGTEGLIRPLTSADGEALADFYATLRPEDERFYCPHPLTREAALKKAADAESPTFVCAVLALPDGTIAGYAWFRWKEGQAQSTFGICISPSFQGLGAGRALLSSINRIAAGVGPNVMSLTVQKANPRAFALYRDMGFHVVREQLRRSDDEPEYYMERVVRGSEETPAIAEEST